MDEIREDECMELADEQLEGIAGGRFSIDQPEDTGEGCLIELPEDYCNSAQQNFRGGSGSVF